MKRINESKTIDFEQLGFQAMQETQDKQSAIDICACHVHALEDEIQPKALQIGSILETIRTRMESLISQLYHRPDPVSDTVMLGRRIAIWIASILILFTFLASAAGHATTFLLIGVSLFLSGGLGIVLTAVVMAGGYLAYDKFLVRHRIAQVAIILFAFGLCFWGVIELAQARNAIFGKASASSQTESYVDGSPEEPAETAPAEANTETNVKTILWSATGKIMIAADLVLGLLLGFVVLQRADPDFAAWSDLKSMGRVATDLDYERNQLLAGPEIAKKHCTAGILRACAQQRRRHIPYHRVLPAFMLVASLLFTVVPKTEAQEIRHVEGILVDISGSVGNAGGNDLFHEYMSSTKKLLQTEPPNTRVYVATITTESFGSVRELVKGWTPGTQGVFTDDLNRARRQLVSAFESRSAGMTPIAAGTDIIGALWHIKALLESTASPQSNQEVTRTIYVFSDMVNETRSLTMPALIGLGSKNMLDHAKANDLIVPLHGYRIIVIGASTRGLTPQGWNTVRAFWDLYFREAGATLVSYSPETSATRIE